MVTVDEAVKVWMWVVRLEGPLESALSQSELAQKAPSGTGGEKKRSLKSCKHSG